MCQFDYTIWLYFRENLMLKQQLKKYVSAIQQLRRDEDFPPDSVLSQGNTHLLTSFPFVCVFPTEGYPSVGPAEWIAELIAE